MVEHRQFTWSQLSTRLDLRMAIGFESAVAHHLHNPVHG
jgi:hypothetical protein